MNVLGQRSRCVRLLRPEALHLPLPPTRACRARAIIDEGRFRMPCRRADALCGALPSILRTAPRQRTLKFPRSSAARWVRREGMHACLRCRDEQLEVVAGV